MPTTPCPSCKQPMAVTSVVCPHCNARRGDVAPPPMSQDEIRAMIAVDSPSPDEGDGKVSTLILPHPATRGLARTVELALTIATLPLVLAGVVTLAFARKRREKYETGRGELVPTLAMAGLGGLGFATILSLLDVSTGMTIAITGGSMLALFVRAGIRGHAASARSRNLHRLPS